MSLPRTALRCLRYCLGLFAIFLIVGCASNTRALAPFGPESGYWQGRIAVKVASTPEQAFSAHFELEGSTQVGRLELTTALGTTVARMEWSPGGADLQASGTARAYPSMAELTLSTMGAELPVDALFQWLRGQAATSAGWQPDLSQWDTGRISAQRQSPEPRVDLKILLER